MIFEQKGSAGVYYTGYGPARGARIATRTRDAGLPEGRRPDGGAGRREAEPEGVGGGAPSGVSRLLDFVRATRVPIDPGRIRA